jgi:hypothetical protein
MFAIYPLKVHQFRIARQQIVMSLPLGSLIDRNAALKHPTAFKLETIEFRKCRIR